MTLLVKEVTVVPYDTLWPKKFEIEASFIKNALQEKCIAVHHIGSTLVTGLSGKDSIDMMLIVRDLKDAFILENHSYEFRGEFNIPLRYFFSKNTDLVKVNLHVVEEGHGFINLQLKFRDYLRSHPKEAEEYGKLKMSLAQDPKNFEKPDTYLGMVRYTLKKNSFIKDILEKAHFDELIVNFCTHELEWEAFHRIRKEVLYDPTGREYNLNHPSLKDPAYHHMILYKGVDIIGVASVQFLADENEAALRPFAIIPSLQGQGLGKWFLAFIEKWVKSKGKNILKMHASLSAENFYRKLGYVDMSFPDKTPVKNIAPSDIVNLGKILS